MCLQRWSVAVQQKHNMTDTQRLTVKIAGMFASQCARTHTHTHMHAHTVLRLKALTVHNLYTESLKHC